MPQIKFPEAEYMTLGRNGFSKACGLSVQDISGTLFLEPINSKGDLTNARIVVPMTHVEQLRDALDQILRDQKVPVPQAKPESMRLLAVTQIPTWQSQEDRGEPPNYLPAFVEQNASYGGVAVTVGTMEVYVEQDAKRGITVSIWQDKESGNDPEHQHEFPLSGITTQRETV